MYILIDKSTQYFEFITIRRISKTIIDFIDNGNKLYRIPDKKICNLTNNAQFSIVLNLIQPIVYI